MKAEISLLLKGIALVVIAIHKEEMVGTSRVGHYLFLNGKRLKIVQFYEQCGIIVEKTYIWSFFNGIFERNYTPRRTSLYGDP